MDRRPPLIARLLLRLVPLGSRRAETEEDLLELFRTRTARYGYGTATLRYFRDLISLFLDGGLVNPFQGLGHDLKYAVRMFARQPIAIGMAILGLGLAMGASGSIFSLLNVALLKSDGVRDSSHAPRVLRTIPNGESTSWVFDEYRRLHDGAAQSQVEAWITESAPYSLSPTLADEPPTVPVAFVTSGYLQALGAQAVSGRILADSDSQPSTQPTVVVSHAFWTRHLSSDPAIVGRTLRIGRVSATVTGVVERPFTAPFHNGAGVWMPLSTWHLVYAGKPVGYGSNPLVMVVTRVKNDVSLAAAEAELTAIAGGFDESGNPDRRAGARFDEDGRLGRPSTIEWFAAVAGVGITISLVLLLACVNVANVLMANAATRQREIGVRLALGASRGRIVRQLLTESVLIATAAAAAGLLLAVWASPLLLRLTGAPSTLDLSVDVNTYGFFVAIAFACGVGAGLLPSRIGARGDLMAPLKGSGTDATSSAPRRLRSSLLAMQAAASILLLVLAALFVRATGRAARVDVGFDAGRLMTYEVGFDRSFDAARVTAYWANATEKAAAIPGVERLALAQFPPFNGRSQVMINEGGGQRTVTYFNRTSANYFDTVGLRLLRGRAFSADEVAADAPVAVISETVARRHFPDGEPLGANLEDALGEKVTVIGLVSDAIVARLHEGTHGTVYMPLSPQHLKGERAELPRLVVRAAGSTALIARPVREALRSVDPSLIVRSAFVQDGLDEEVSRPRIVAMVAGAMAILAVILAAIGLYGVTGSVVSQRTREIGLRMALGAECIEVERLLMRESLRPVLVGLTIGIFLALLGGRAIAGGLYGIPSYDPIAFVGAAAILLASAVLAVRAPTRRAARVDPAFVLRQG